MTAIGKRIVAGALIALGGAFVWALLGFTSWFVQSHNSGEMIFTVIGHAGSAVQVATWFVVPVGGILGAVMPRIMQGCSQRRAFLRGALPGICAGVVAAIITIAFVDERPRLSGRAMIVDREAWERAFVTGSSTISLP